MDEDIKFGFEITKFDMEQRLVVGWCSSDNFDRQGDRVPYEVMVQTMSKYATIAGIREMHQPKAVGRINNWWGDPNLKKVGVELYISSTRDGDDVLTKVNERILKGLSIAGRAESWKPGPTGGRVITGMSLTEISLVDVPANPDAIITMVKYTESDTKLAQVVSPTESVEKHLIAVTIETEGGGESLAVETVAEPALEEGSPIDPDIQDLRARIDNLQVMVRELGGRLPLVEEPTAAVEAPQPINSDDLQIADLRERGARIGISRRPGEPVTNPPGYSNNPSLYGDPANWCWPCDTDERCLASVEGYNSGQGRDNYTPREWSALGRRVTNAASERFECLFSFDPITKIIRKEQIMEPTQIQKNAQDFRAELDTMLLAGGDLATLRSSLLSKYDATVGAAVAPLVPPGNQPSLADATDGISKTVTPAATVPAGTAGSDVAAVLQTMQATNLALLDLVKSLATAPATVINQIAPPKAVDPNIPAADVVPTTPATMHPIEKALTENPPEIAFQKAVEAANGDAGAVYTFVDQRVRQMNVLAGINSAHRALVGTPNGNGVN